MKSIAIIIVNWNGGADTVDCLTSLAASSDDRLDVHVFIVDNASSDDSVGQIQSYISSYRNSIHFHLIRNTENRGFAGGNNDGMKQTVKLNCDYVVLLNNDTIVAKDFIAQFTDSFSENADVGIIGPKIYFAKGFEYHLKRYQKSELGNVLWYAGGIIDWNNIYLSHRGVDEVDRGQYDRAEETAFISGCCMGIRAEVIEKIGLLDERYFMYLEDADYCMRAKRAGFILQYNPKAYLWHKNAQSTGKPGSTLHQYFQTRNRLLFGFRYAPLRTKIALLRESIRLLTASDIRKKAVIDFYLRRFGNVLSYQW